MKVLSVKCFMLSFENVSNLQPNKRRGVFARDVLIHFDKGYVVEFDNLQKIVKRRLYVSCPVKYLKNCNRPLRVLDRQRLEANKVGLTHYDNKVCPKIFNELDGTLCTKSTPVIYTVSEKI